MDVQHCVVMRMRALMPLPELDVPESMHPSQLRQQCAVQLIWAFCWPVMRKQPDPPWGLCFNF